MSSCFVCTSFFFWTTLIPSINVIMQSIMTTVVMMIGFFFFMAFSFLKDWFYGTSLFYDVVVWV